MQILLLQTFSTCFGHHASIIRSTKCSLVLLCYILQNYVYRWLPCQHFVLLMMGAWCPKHVEKVCSNKICILLHHVGVLFNLHIGYLWLHAIIFIIIIINIQGWAIWPVPSPELQLLSPSLLRSPNCSLSLWAVEVWFQGDSVLWNSLYVCEPVPSVFIYFV